MVVCRANQCCLVLAGQAAPANAGADLQESIQGEAAVARRTRGRQRTLQILDAGTAARAAGESAISGRLQLLWRRRQRRRPYARVYAPGVPGIGGLGGGGIFSLSWSSVDMSDNGTLSVQPSQGAEGISGAHRSTFCDGGSGGSGDVVVRYKKKAALHALRHDVASRRARTARALRVRRGRPARAVTRQNAPRRRRRRAPPPAPPAAQSPPLATTSSTISHPTAHSPSQTPL